MKFFPLFVVLIVTALFAKENYLNVSMAALAFDYREYDSEGVLLDTEESDFSDVGGVSFLYQSILTENTTQQTYLQAYFLYMYGPTHYIGSYLSSNQGYGSVHATTDNDFTQMAVDYGVVKALKDNWSFLYVGGVGYREWSRALSASQIELYSWFSLRARMGFVYETPLFRISPDIGFEYGIAPTMTILATTQNPDTTLDLGSANIYSFSLPVAYKVGEGYELTCKYTFEYQDIQESNTVDYILGGVVKQIYEPQSKSYNQYIEVGIGYSF